ncbi:Protein HIR2 [Cyberlindnera fabianii]|uniref:Protein HIR n=1 Tax=Cyberlindnera fabianii TaxID=36022 RepID=A0A1V2L3M2_CYBFA|nr:Protein HIR2 [Cyberlindnera fabianii]
MRLLKVPTSTLASPVTALALNSDSKWLVTASEDGVVRVWDVKTLSQVASSEKLSRSEMNKLKPIREIHAHEGVNLTAVYIHDNQAISCDVTGKVFKTDLTTGESSHLFTHTAQINDIASVDHILLLATETCVLSYDLSASKFLSEIPSRSEVRALCVDPSKAYLETVSLNKVTSLYQIELFNGDILYKKITIASQTLAALNENTKISWSPSGDRLALPNVNLDPNTHAIGMISRSNWKSDFSLIGHNSNVVRFNPVVFNGEAGKVYQVIASSGMDKSIAVWNTTLQRPLFAAADATTQIVTDMQWTHDGLTLFAAAESLMIFVFSPDELGVPIEDSLLKDMLSKLKVPELLQSKISATSATPGATGNTASGGGSTPVSTNATPSAQTVPAANSAASPPSNDNSASGATTTVKTLEPSIPPAEITKKDGKKRVAPTLVSKSGNGNSTSTTATSQLLPSARLESHNTVMEFDSPSYTAPKSLNSQHDATTETGDQPPRKKRDVEPVEFIGSVAINPNTSFAKVRISTPKIRSTFTHDSPDDETLMLEVRNGSGTEQKPTKITLFKNSTKQVFTDFIPKLAGLATGGEGYFWAVSTVDGVLYVYSDSGRRVFPPIVLGTPLSFLEGKGKYLLAVTSIGVVYVWDVIAGRALFEPTSLYPLLSRSNQELLTRAENITLCSVSSSGVPVVTISNGNGYMYDMDLDAWTLISDSWWAFGSQYWDSRDAKDDGSIVGILEKKTNDEIVRRGRGKFLQKMAKTMLMKEGYENLEKTISLAHLENRILVSYKLKDDGEFKTHLIIYCKRVSEMGFKARLLEVFEELMGPGESDPTWDNKILSFDKHELLKELIFACASFRVVQRILVQFATDLNILDSLAF